MKSRAQFKGHPLHPMLVAFPIAFLYGCLVADVIGRVLGRPSLWAAGAYSSIAAVATGLIAGVPGLVDYLSIVPPGSSGKKRATQHMSVNLAALALVAIGCFFRDWRTLTPGWITIVLEFGGAALVTWGGWMGGTLVYRNQIGVDHRFAHAGKWHEATVKGSPGETIAVDGADVMKPGQMWLLHWKSASGDRRLVLGRTEDGFAAFDDHCTHRGGSLADGTLICGTVQCPWHGSQFDVRDGQVKAGPARQPIGTCRAELHDGRVQVTLPTEPRQSA
jgi:uncharacterized membrane protein/nitrite reductase/ring-hydroxylating ferredoxin subunit